MFIPFVLLPQDPSQLRTSLSSSIASAALLAAAASSPSTILPTVTTTGAALASLGLSTALPASAGGAGGADAASGAVAGGLGAAAGSAGGKQQFSAPAVWREALELLRRETVETPVLLWNDTKRQELHAVGGGVEIEIETGFRGGGNTGRGC